MNNVNIIIDGNYLFHRCIGVINWNLFKHPDYLVFQDQKTRKILKQEVLKHLYGFLKKHKHDLTYKRIIFVSDSYSWRYDIYSEYKAGREKSRSSNLDYKELSSIISEFNDELSQSIIKLNLNKLEGDDLIYLVSNYIYNKYDENVIIIASDVDLTSLTKTDVSKNKYIIHYNINKEGKITATNDFVKMIKSIKTPSFNIFEMDKQIQSANNKFVISIVENETSIFINPFHVIIDKIIGGDSSDNISNLWTGLGKKTRQKFIDYLVSINFDFDDLISKFLTFNDNYYVEFINMLNDFCKITPRAKTYTQPLSTIVEHLKLNFKLVYIHHGFYPKASLKMFNSKLLEGLLDNIYPQLNYKINYDNNIINHRMFDNISKLEDKLKKNESDFTWEDNISKQGKEQIELNKLW